MHVKGRSNSTARGKDGSTMAEVTSTYCGGIIGDRDRIPFLITLKYKYPALFFTDAILLTRPARSISIAWWTAQVANDIPGLLGMGFGLPVRPFRRYDFFKVTRIFTELTREGGTGLTSEKAAAALHKYVHVVPTAQVTRLHIAETSSHQISFQVYYGNDRKAEFTVMKWSSAAVTNIFRKTFGDRFDASLTTDLPEGALLTTALPEGAISPVPAYRAPLPATNSMAKWSMRLGIAEFFTGGLTAIHAIIYGHVARRQIRVTGQRGDELATRGLVLGYLAIISWIALAAVFVFAYATRPSPSTAGSSSVPAPASGIFSSADQVPEAATIGIILAPPLSPVGIHEKPSLNSPMSGKAVSDDIVAIACATQGDAVTNAQTGHSSRWWDSISGYGISKGYVPAVFVSSLESPADIASCRTTGAGNYVVGSR
jgi:hypothetical protein